MIEWWVVPGALLPAAMVFVWLRRTYGTDPSVLPLAPDYMRAPPTADPPALAGALVRGTGDVAQEEFLATFFDLIRRGFFSATHEARTRRDGAAVELDLRVRLTKQPPIGLHPWERRVYESMEWVIPPSGRLLGDFGPILMQRRQKFSIRFMFFREQVATELRRRGWIDDGGRRAWSGSIGLFALAGTLALAAGVADTQSIRPVLVTAGAAGAGNAIALAAFGIAWPSALTRRAGPGVAVARRWEAFGRFLRDFSALSTAPPGSVAIWETYLVYGIALGCADQVVATARRLAGTELEASSGLYWFGSAGARMPITSLAITSLLEAFRSPAGLFAKAWGTRPPLFDWAQILGRTKSA